MKWKSDHISTFDFNTPDIRARFEQLKKINKKILLSMKIDSEKLKIRFDI